MLDNRYEVEISSNSQKFEFVSTGSRGSIHKAVRYTFAGQPNLYNLGFGDYDSKMDLINDLSVSDNGDTRKVLATVAATLYIFTEQNPEAYVVVAGSTSSRTRLYRMGISNNFSAIDNDFYVWGFRDEDWQVFEKGIDYEGFLVKRKL